jgi:hypothetical protein
VPLLTTYIIAFVAYKTKKTEKSMKSKQDETQSKFDMCCSVHFCDSNFYNQQMHTLYFVGHFIGLKTCFNPYGSSSGHLIHWTLNILRVYNIRKCFICYFYLFCICFISYSVYFYCFTFLHFYTLHFNYLIQKHIRIHINIPRLYRISLIFTCFTEWCFNAYKNIHSVHAIHFQLDLATDHYKNLYV